jgi:uncharacterized protein YbjT (DUF2867 family)
MPSDPAVLVTGATGTVGRHVVAGLSETDATVRAATRDADAAREQLGHDVASVAFDFAKPETYYPALDGIDRLFLVRPPAVGRVERDINPFLDAAVRMGVDHVVVLSVLGAEKNPLLPHRRIERHVESLAVDHTFLRASFFMQNLTETHLQDIVAHDEVFVPAGGGRTSFVDARDIAAVAVETLTTPGHRNVAYDVTGASAIDYHAVAAILSDVLARRIEYPEPSVLGFALRMRSRGVSWGFVAVMVGIYTTARLGLAARVTEDVRDVLGRDPRSFRAFVEDYRDMFAPADGSR